MVFDADDDGEAAGAFFPVAAGDDGGDDAAPFALCAVTGGTTAANFEGDFATGQDLIDVLLIDEDFDFDFVKASKCKYWGTFREPLADVGVFFDDETIEGCAGKSFFAFGFEEFDVFALCFEQCFGLLFLFEPCAGGHFLADGLGGDEVLAGGIEGIFAVFDFGGIGGAAAAECAELFKTALGVGGGDLQGFDAGLGFFDIFATRGLEFSKFGFAGADHGFLFGQFQISGFHAQS